MNKSQVTDRTYIAPAIEIIGMENPVGFMDTSVKNNGGHKKGGDDGEDLNAKQGFFDEEDEEEASENGFGSIW